MTNGLDKSNIAETPDEDPRYNERFDLEQMLPDEMSVVANRHGDPRIEVVIPYGHDRFLELVRRSAIYEQAISVIFDTHDVEQSNWAMAGFWLKFNGEAFVLDPDILGLEVNDDD